MINLADEDLVYNTSKRVPVCLCIDNSVKSDADNENVSLILNLVEKGILQLYKKIMSCDTLRDCAEVGIITFNNRVSVLQNYSGSSKFNLGLELGTGRVFGGSGDVGSGILRALEILQTRKQLYQVHGVDYYTPWLVIITDGKPGRKECKKNLALARKNVLKLEKQGKLVIVTVYVDGSDNKDTLHFNLNLITKQSKKKSSRLSAKIEPQIIGKSKVVNLFDWLGKTLDDVAFENEIKLDFSGLTDWEDI